MKIKIISVDFQKEFSAKGGKHYNPHSNVDFIKNVLVLFLRKKNIKIAEIISDYRFPRPGGNDDCCNPGKEGYKSEIPQDVKLRDIWVKRANSPIWISKNRGDSNKKPGVPFQDTEAFTKWLNANVGKVKDVDEIVLIGLTIDCCVLSTAQELRWRGYKVKILKEGVDVYSGKPKEKEMILNNLPLLNWAKVISWKDLKEKLK